MELTDVGHKGILMYYHETRGYQVNFEKCEGTCVGWIRFEYF